MNVKQFINKLNEKGIPLPLIRIGGKPTLTGTMAFLAFNTALLGQIGKVTKYLGEVDLSQANYLLIITLGAYLGRRFKGDGKTAELEGKEETK